MLLLRTGKKVSVARRSNLELSISNREQSYASQRQLGVISIDAMLFTQSRQRIKYEII
jgi:hypothetical protein